MDVADILKEAYDGVAAELSGVIKAATVSRTTASSYDADTGLEVQNAPLVQTGQGLLEDERTLSSMRAVFPGYVFTGTERLVLLRGLSWAPIEGDMVTVDSLPTKRAVAVLDLLGAGAGFRVIIV